MPTKKGPRRASYQDVLDAPEHLVAEVVDGMLYTHPRPAPLHTYAYSELGAKLRTLFGGGNGGAGGWLILLEPELHLQEDILVPDVAGWRRERMPAPPQTAYFTLAPDWVCEILSPSTRRLDQSAKRDVYAREGITHLWFVDPEAQNARSVRTARRPLDIAANRERRNPSLAPAPSLPRRSISATCGGPPHRNSPPPAASRKALPPPRRLSRSGGLVIFSSHGWAGGVQ